MLPSVTTARASRSSRCSVLECCALGDDAHPVDEAEGGDVVLPLGDRSEHAGAVVVLGGEALALGLQHVPGEDGAVLLVGEVRRHRCVEGGFVSALTIAPWPLRRKRAFGYARQVNPAQSLYEFLMLARDASLTGAPPRASRELDDKEGMERQLRAVTDLLALRRGLDELSDAGLPVRTYQKYVQSWTQMVLSYPEGWKNSIDVDSAYPESTLDHLHTLAGWFATARPMPTRQSQDELRSFLLDVQALLESDDTISGELKVYLGRLIREMENALDDEQLLERFDFDEAGRRLWTALFAASAQTTDDEKKSAWTDLANKLWWPTTAGALASAPSIIAGVLTASGHN